MWYKWSVKGRMEVSGVVCLGREVEQEAHLSTAGKNGR